MNSAQKRFTGILLLLAGAVLLGWRVVRLAVQTPGPPFARIKVQKEVVGKSGVEYPVAAYDTDFVHLQMDVIRSESILAPVLANFNSNHVADSTPQGPPPDAAGALRWLQRRLKVEMVPKTALVDIQVNGRTPEESAALANSIAAAYRDRVRQRREQRVADAVRAQEQDWARISEEISDVQEKVNHARIELGIVNGQPANPFADTNQVQVWQALEARLAALKESRQEFETDAFHRLLSEQRLSEPLVEVVRPATLLPPLPATWSGDYSGNVIAITVGTVLCLSGGVLVVMARRPTSRRPGQ